MTPIEKHKISILTFWGVPNYGAFAQAYALNKKIQEMFPDYYVEHIGYLDSKHKDSYFKRIKPKLHIKGNVFQIDFLKSIYNYLVHLYRYYIIPQHTYELFNNAWNSIPNVKIQLTKELEEQNWDIVVTGSDCIWQFSTETFGNDAHLIGKDLKYNRLVAYACSFGNQSGELPEFVAEQLKQYDYISIRDTFSEKIIKSETNGYCKSCLVLDPTLIYDFKSDHNIVPYQTNDQKYIFVYGDAFPKKMTREIIKYAKDNGLTTIGAGKVPKWCDIKMSEISPFEWIGMFQNAEFVVTNTFHGMMFCLIYNKMFYFQQEPYVKNRSAYILKLLGLDKLFLTEDFNIKKMLNYDWNYEKICRILHEKRKESECFLYDALS